MENTEERNFTLKINDEEKKYLRNLVLLSITKLLNGKDPEQEIPALPDLKDTILKDPLGAFVTLKKTGNLRGCIGRLSSPDPLYLTIIRMAAAAAFHDQRFTPLRAEELEGLELEISILSPITLCPDPYLIQIGRHGLIIKRGYRQGLLLPQVPLEWRWTLDEFLQHTCQKAGLPANAWKEKGTEIFWFEAEII